MEFNNVFVQLAYDSQMPIWDRVNGGYKLSPDQEAFAKRIVHTCITMVNDDQEKLNILKTFGMT